ncbi:MAG: hypothetical protein ABSG33_08500 [Candidatus Bathyarchaeia archaeon]|jgi:hypothetical protein
MNQKESCPNTDYTDGFKITTDKDGYFVAVKGENKLRAKSAEEINMLIKNFHEPAEAAEKKPEGSKVHDECVRTIAEDLKKDNWLVKANAEGWDKPSEVAGVVPDVVAHKGCLKRICQIVNEKDFAGDKANYRDFKNFCREYEFQLYVIDKDGKTRTVDV